MDSGATSNFFTTNAAVINIKPTSEPLHVRIPNGACLHSSHTCELDIPQLPEEARKGHIIPGMQGYSLVSLVQLCKAGCQVQINRNGLYIWYRGFVILEGQKCPRTGLWLIPLTKKNIGVSKEGQDPSHVAGNVYHTSMRAEWIQYLHQACFSPAVATWCKAIDKDQFLSWPGLTSDAVRKYLPALTATIKGHMARPQQRIRSSTKPRRTKQREKIELVGNASHEIEEDMHPNKDPNAVPSVRRSHHWRSK
jgi:hypothetical protein